MSSRFVDNTVLCNFAAIDRLDLLRDWLRDRGRWSEAVAAEAGLSAQHLPALVRLIEEGWLGEPIRVDGNQQTAQVEGIRRHVFGGSNSQPLKHLGEAQTLWLIQHVERDSGAIWVSDDQDSLDHAKQQSILTRRTRNILEELIAEGELAPEAAFDLLLLMEGQDRLGLCIPSSPADLVR